MICDNARFHTSQEVIEYLWEHEDRIEVHLLPNYSPDYNPIERVWWHLHENITRNHRCKDLGELLDRVFTWLEQGKPVRDRGFGLPEGEGRLSHFPLTCPCLERISLALPTSGVSEESVLVPSRHGVPSQPGCHTRASGFPPQRGGPRKPGATPRGLDHEDQKP